MTQSDVTKCCFSEVEGSCRTSVKFWAVESSEQCDQVLDTLEPEHSIVGVNLGGVSARVYALSALDQVDLASPRSSYPECHSPTRAMAMCKR